MLYDQNGQRAGQRANPFKKRSPESYEQEPQKRALGRAITGGSSYTQELNQDRSNELTVGGFRRPRKAIWENDQNLQSEPQTGPLQEPFQPTAPIQATDKELPKSPASGPDISLWDTDQFAAPKFTVPGASGPMAGWGQENWSNQNMQTPKYVAGRIMSQYNAGVPGDVDKAIAEIQQAYPGSTFDGKDKITIPGVGTIDIIAGAGGGSPSWAWQDTSDPGYASPGGGFGSGSMMGAMNRMPWESNNTQEGGDALQAIYQILGPLLSELLQGKALTSAITGGQ